MNFGQGSIGFVNKVPTPAPATVADANNGTSLSGTDVQLGQDVGAVGNPAVLLNDREIPLSGFAVDFLGNLISVNIDDAAALFKVYNGANDYLLIDAANNLFSFGDIGGVNNNTRIDIDDVAQTVSIASNNGKGLLLDFANEDYAIGGDIYNGTVLEIISGIDYTVLYSPNGTFLTADGAFDQYRFGLVGTAHFDVDIPTTKMSAKIGGANYLEIDFGAQTYRFGRPQFSGNGFRLLMTDSTGVFDIDNAAHNALVRINNVDGFTGTVLAPSSITVNGGIVTAVT